jgi:hypothetical protein
MSSHSATPLSALMWTLRKRMSVELNSFTAVSAGWYDRVTR